MQGNVGTQVIPILHHSIPLSHSQQMSLLSAYLGHRICCMPTSTYRLKYLHAQNDKISTDNILTLRNSIVVYQGGWRIFSTVILRQMHIFAMSSSEHRLIWPDNPLPFFLSRSVYWVTAWVHPSGLVSCCQFPKFSLSYSSVEFIPSQI